MRAFLILLFILLFSSQAHAVTQTQLEAVFLEKFTHLIEWPEASEREDFTICILNNKKFAEAIERIYKSKKRDENRKINIIHLADNEEIPHCQLLFIGKETKDIKSTLKKIAGKPTLTVSNHKEHVDEEVMITMFPVDNRFQYIINNKAAQKADIKISYLLLKSAHEVIK